jgi:serine/threonine protein kinase
VGQDDVDGDVGFRRIERFGSEYVLRDEVGRGAMGTVYDARKEETGERVAIKTLHPHLLADKEAVGRFIQERDAFERVEHPNVVRVHDLLMDRGRLGIVMEFLGGQDLKTMLSGRPLKVTEALEISRALAGGLEAIHDAGIVHRDLKPSNVMLDAEGEKYTPKIVDFGICRILGDTVNTVTTGIGTPVYMAPEATQEGLGAGAPADVYALGVMLFEFLIGEPPFSGENVMALIRAHNEDPPPLVRGVPRELTALIDQMLAKEPETRPDATAVRRSLTDLAPLVDAASKPFLETAATTFQSPILSSHTEPGVLAETTGNPKPVTPAGPSVPYRRRSSLLGVAGVLVLVALAALTGITYWSFGRGDPAEAARSYTFGPRAIDGELEATHQWTLPDAEPTVSVLVRLSNVSDGLIETEYVEVFAPEIIDGLDDIDFATLPADLLRDELAVRYEVALGPGESQSISYSFPVDEGLTDGEFQRLVDAQQKAADDFYGPQAGPARDEQGDEANEIALDSDGVRSGQAGASNDLPSGPTESIADDSPASPSSSSSSSPETTQPTSIGAESPPTTAPSTGTTRRSTTVATTRPLVISGFRAINVTSSSARIVWDSSECANSQIELNGELTTNEFWPRADTTCWEQHGRNYSNLAPGTTYSVVVRVADRSGRIVSQGPINFTTLEEEERSPLVISGFRAINVTSSSARIVWDSSECANSQIELNGALTTNEFWPDADTRCWEQHGRNYTNLAPDTTYSVVVRVADRSGRIVSQGPINFTTLSE